MVGVDLAIAGTADLGDEGLDRLEQLLSVHDIRVSFGRSRWTGQPIIRLVDGHTGQPRRQIPRPVVSELAGLAAELARQARQR
ncbi:MAG TPA: hypothetical protein VGK32_00840 [Vicinamibacterales bacterium]|jgi:uncharacterized FlaG/YvyC family protein